MTEKDKEWLKRAEAFLDEMGVEYEGEVIVLTDGGNSVVCNMETEWQEFLGCSVNEVARAVAKRLRKPTKRVSEKHL